MSGDTSKKWGTRFPRLLLSWLRSARPGLLSALLLYLSFPPRGYSLLSFIALVPLLTLVSAKWRSRPIYGPALACGAVFGLLTVSWIRHSDQQTVAGYLGWFALAAYLALYFPAFILLMRIAVLRFRVPGIIATPLIWVGLEYLRSWALSGFPWYFLGHALYRWTTLIQVADLAGAYGVSLCVALVNGWVYDLVAAPLMRPSEEGPRLAQEQRWRLAVLLVTCGLWVTYGFVRTTTQPGVVNKRTVALMQTNVPQKLKTDDSRRTEIIQHYGSLIRLIGDRQVDLIVWPETAYRGEIYRVDDRVTDADVKRIFGEAGSLADLKDAAKKWDDVMAKTASESGSAVLWGLNGVEVVPQGVRSYNSAILVDPEQGLSPLYHKIHLVPWGEYQPFADTLPFLTALTPHASSDYGADAGDELVRFSWGDLKFGVLICFEDTVPWLARRYVTHDPVDFFVNISNDGWFLDSAELEVHLAASVFRAVECGRPLIRAVNTSVSTGGPIRASAIIDVRGRVVKDSTMGLKAGGGGAVLLASIPLEKRDTFYAATGDWLGVAAFSMIILMLLATVAMVIASRNRHTVEQ